jgi:hypothetical protein
MRDYTGFDVGEPLLADAMGAHKPRVRERSSRLQGALALGPFTA